MQKRESGPDLIRCVALLFVTGIHFYLYNGFYYEKQIGMDMLLPNTFRWLFYTCNGVFLMLTGYLRGTKKAERGFYRGLIPVLAGYVMICVLTFPIRHFLIGEQNTILDWLKKLVSFANYAWFLEMYVGLILMSPMLNVFLDFLQDRRKLLIFAAIMVSVTSLHSVTALNLVPDHWTATYPMTYYVIGSVIRRLQPEVKPWIALSGAFLVALGLGAVSLWTTDDGFSKGFTQGYGGFWVIMITTLLFLGLYRLQPGKNASRLLAWAAPGCMEGYLISRLFDVWIYDRFANLHNPVLYGILFLIVTVPVWLVSLLLGKLVHSLTAMLIKPFMKERSREQTPLL